MEADLVRIRQAARTGPAAAEPVEGDDEAAVGESEEGDQIEEWLRSASSQWKAFTALVKQNMVQQARMGMKMMSAMMKPKTK